MSHRLDVDWGSSRLRIMRRGDGRDEIRIADTGAAALIGGGAVAFEAAFTALAGDWLEGCEAVRVTGMATARGGWRETPYLPCPADLSRLDEADTPGWIDGVPVRFGPGLIDETGPDVIRGEEAQIAALAGGGARLVILPGTHSKWVRLEGSVVTGFRTFLTGELFELALTRSLAGRLAQGRGHDPGAFDEGLRAAAEGAPFNALFLARARGLTGALAPEATAAFLSGVCIGSEIAQARQAMNVRDGVDIALCGAAALLPLYARAIHLARLGLPSLHETS